MKSLYKVCVILLVILSFFGCTTNNKQVEPKPLVPQNTTSKAAKKATPPLYNPIKNIEIKQTDAVNAINEIQGIDVNQTIESNETQNLENSQNNQTKQANETTVNVDGKVLDTMQMTIDTLMIIRTLDNVMRF